MRILKIWDSDYPWDIRVEKIIKALSENGHSVSLVCRNLKCLPTFEEMDHIRIHRLPAVKNRVLNHFLSFPYFFNLFWLKRIYVTAKKDQAEVLLVRDLPLALAAIIVGRWLGIPVVLDMAENYPAMLKGRRYLRGFRLHQLLIRNATLARIIEGLALKWVQKVIVVVEENRRRLVRAGFRPEDIYLVSNTPELEVLNNSAEYIGYEEKRFFAGRFTLIYVGGLGVVRGLEMVISGMRKVAERIPEEVHLLIVGSGQRENILKRIVENNHLEEHVTFKGWVEHKYLPQYLAVSRAGLIPHLSTEHTNTTIPNKIFDYMAFGLPVIASDVAPIKRIIQEERCGVTFEANNPDDFFNAVVKVYSDKENGFGENGKAAISRRYNWKEDSAILLKIFADLERMGPLSSRT